MCQPLHLETEQQSCVVSVMEPLIEPWAVKLEPESDWDCVFPRSGSRNQQRCHLIRDHSFISLSQDILKSFPLFVYKVHDNCAV